MAKRREINIVLDDMIRFGNDALAFCEGKSFEDFQNDVQLRYAVYRCFEVIGEAAASLPRELTLQYKEVPWAAIVALRNIVIHQYDGIDDANIWNVLTEHLPGTIKLLEKLKNSPDA